MSITVEREIWVCECCVVAVENGDDSGCRDHYGHGHDAPRVPTGLVLGDETRETTTSTTCDGCGQALGAFATLYRYQPI